MKLVYCWIKNYLNIPNQDFNFGSQWIYSVKEESDKTLTIYRSKNDKYVKDFFKLAKNGFENVTAIVGENGAGKTNFLDYLGVLIATLDSPYYLSQGDALDIDPKGAILIFEDESGSIFVKKYVNIVNAEFTIEDLLTPNHVISYSPIYDFRNLNIGDKDHFTDISSNYFISKDTQDGRSLIEDNFLGIEFHKTSEVRRQLSFLNKIKEKDKEKPIYQKLLDTLFIPEKITISIRDTSIPSKDELRNLLTLHNVVEKALDVYERELLLLKSNRHHNNLLKYFHFLKTLFSIIIRNANYKYLTESFNDANDKISSINVNDSFKYIELSKETHFDITDFLQFESFFKTFLNNQTYFDKESILRIMDTIKFYLIFTKYPQNDITIFKDDALAILTDYENVIKNYTVNHNHPMTIGFLDFNWEGMSSGEISFLNLFSRLHHAHTQLDSLETYPPEIYLLIDEGEQGFHFRWQKEYLKTLIQFVPQIFKTGTKIHLIFATHSPITLSDMPNHHIVFLKKDNNNKVKVLTNNERVKQTFAANIHEILYDSFFMDKGFIGAFAVEKINAVFKYLNDELLKKNKQKSEYRLKKDKKHQSYKAIISNIDEPLIRVKLEEKMAELEEIEDPRQREIDSLEAQQKRIEERLKNLKDKDNDTNTTQS